MLHKIKYHLILCISIVVILFPLYIDFNPNMMMPIGLKIVLYIFAILLIFIDMKIKIRKEDNEKAKKIIRNRGVSIIFIMYSIFAITTLLLDGNFRRARWEDINLFSRQHLEYYVNIIPFATISDYIKRLIQDEISIKIMVSNLAGNILILAPFGLFLPMLFRDKINNKKFLLVMIGIALIIECIQFITMSGTFDVDDIILNVTGALIVYGIIKIKAIKNVIDKALK